MITLAIVCSTVLVLGSTMAESISDYILEASNTMDKYKNATEYRVFANSLDLSAVDTYPQKIKTVISDKPMYVLDLLVHQDINKIKPVEYKKYKYSRNISIYLNPSAKIESSSEEVKKLTQTIAPGEKDIIKIAQKAADWTASNIKFDKQLAQEITSGASSTQSAVETIKRKTGTCGEYTNVFIAIMRCRDIPARFVAGYVYGGVYHSWAEIYLKGIGWVPVDPQIGTIGIDDTYIKLFIGKDFEDSKIKLRDIGIYVIKSN